MNKIMAFAALAATFASADIGSDFTSVETQIKGAQAKINKSNH